MNLWGFERITSGLGKGGYERAEFFSRKDPNQISHIKRRKIKNARFSKKKISATTTIADAPTSKLDIQALSSSSIVSNSYSDVSSVSSDTVSEKGFTSVNDDLSPIPISEMIQHSSCSQTGDWSNFEGRSFFFVDEEESKQKISQSRIVSPRSTEMISSLQTSSVQRVSPQEITLCPSSRAGIALYRQFFSKNTSMPRAGGLRV